MEKITFLQGGALLMDPSISRCQAIVNMVSDTRSNLSLLTYKSLKGFIFKLDVNDLNKCLFRYWRYLQEPKIQDYLIKLVIITKDNDEDLPEFRKRDKSSESMNSFMNEAKIQARIWELSTLSSTPNFSPSVIDFSLFENPIGTHFLTFLKTKVAPGSLDEEVIDYLISVIQDPVNRLGMLVMPFLNNSVTLGTFVSEPANAGMLTDIYINCLSKVVGLYLFNGLLHYDLHTDNILIKNRDGKYIPYVIDFGRVSQVDLRDPDEYFSGDEHLSKAEQTAAFKQRNDFRDELDTLIMPKRGENQAAFQAKQIIFIRKVIDYVCSMDHMIVQREFKMPTKQSFQMEWILHILNEPNNTLLDGYLLRIFTTVIQDNIVDDVGTKLGTVQLYKREGKLINFVGVSPRAFFTSPTIPGISASAAPSSAMSSPSSASSSLSQAHTNPVLPKCDEEGKGYGCSLMGGRRRSTKKYKKNRRISRKKI